MTSQFTFMLGSARHDGNAELLARRAAESLPAASGERWIHLEDVVLPRFVDHRHTRAEIPQPEGTERELLDATLGATDIVLVTPMYWYNVSASTKLLLDYWAGWMKVPGLNFTERMAGKTLWTVMSFADDDQSVAAPVTATLEMTAAYLGMTWGGLVLGYGSAPGQVLTDTRAMDHAEEFFVVADRAREASTL